MLIASCVSPYNIVLFSLFSSYSGEIKICIASMFVYFKIIGTDSVQDKLADSSAYKDYFELKRCV